jgi:sodium/potassium/calcium exchanger 6
VFTALLTWLFFLFATLGITASDFFTPNLATIAGLLGLDDNMTGVTFLAFGNGAPDLSSTYSAMRAGSGSLAIGELLGAASFIVSCVVGSMCIIRPFHVYPLPFLRDVGFFAAAVSLLLVILQDSRIQLWEAVSMIALYVLYALVVGFGSWWEKRQEQKKALARLIHAAADDDDDDDNGGGESATPYRDEPETSRSPELSPLRFASPTPARTRSFSTPVPPRLLTNLPVRSTISRTPSPSPSMHPSHLPSFSLLGAIEFHQEVASLQASGTSLSMFESPLTPYPGGHYHHHRARGVRSPSIALPPENSPWDVTLASPCSVPLDDRSPQRGLLIHSPSPEGRSAGTGETSQQHLAVPSVCRTPSSPTPSDTSDSSTYIPITQKQRFMQNIAQAVHTLFPTLHHFRKQSLIGKIASIFAAPAVLALTVTLPVIVTPSQFCSASREKLYGDDAPLVGFEEEGVQRALIAEEEAQESIHEVKFNKWLMAVQCAIAPVFCVGVLFTDAENRNWLLLAATIGGLAMALLVAVFAGKGERLSGRMAACSMGFLVSIVWIMAIADEVVNVLQAFGFIFGLSDAIIGLTIFAVGNSLADLVANMTVAAFAPIMGFSACFGSPMLNILLGIGISGTYIISQTGRDYELDFSRSLHVSTIALLCLLGATLVFVPLNRYHLTRMWGILLILSYVTIMIINIAVELRS